jgi:DeoR/GlpR family transcriptional regulator of sugar metabolism
VMAGDEKAVLGARAADMVKPGQVIFLDGGTTTAALARALPRSFAFTVVTHSPTIACELERHPTADVVLIGGKLYKHSMVTGGAVALEAIRSLKADLYFMGVTAAHPTHGLTTGDMEEAATKRIIAGNAAATVVLLTEDKLGRASPWKITPLSAATALVVPAGLAPERLAPYRDLDVEIVEA